MDNGIRIPVVGVGVRLVRRPASLPVLVGRGCEYPFLPQRLGNLHRAASLHAEVKDVLDHLGRFLVHQPLRLVLLVLDIAVWGVYCQRLAALPFGLVHRAYLAAGIFCKKLVEPVFYTSHVVVHAVGVDGVEVVVDGDIPYSILGEGEIDIQPLQGRIAAQPR